MFYSFQSYLVKFLTSAFVAVTFLKADICIRDHYMHVDVHCVVCRSLHVAVHYQSAQAVTLEVASEDVYNASLAEFNHRYT